MTDTNVSLFDDLCNMLEQSEPDFLRRAVAMLFQQIMDADVTQRVGATRHQRTGVRRNYRNGFRRRLLDTRIGAIELQIPKLRAETYFPPFLTHRQRSEAALISVVQQAYVNGISTRLIEIEVPYLLLDATYLKVHQNHRIVACRVCRSEYRCGRNEAHSRRDCFRR